MGNFDGMRAVSMRKRRWAAVAGSLALVVALSACSSGSQTDAGADNTLRVGVGGGASTDSLDPFHAVNTTSLARVAQINETLMRYTPDFEIEPYLADSLESNEDATVWTIKLKSGISFHNGDPLTSADVKATFEAIENPDNPGAAVQQLSTLKLDEITTPDDLTIVVPFSAPYAAFPDALAMAGTSAIRIIPQSGFDPAAPIGTGPFMYKSFTPGQSSTFVKNPNYWQEGKPSVDSVEIIDINDDSARVNALMSGQVDAIAGVPSASVSTLEANSDVSMLISETGAFNPIVMRTDMAPFDDVRVRQAFRLIADRQQLVDSALNGYGSVANDLFGRYEPTSGDPIEQRKQDIAEARRLLDEAGQSNLVLEFPTANIKPGVVQAAQVFAQQAAEAGVTINVLEVQPTDFWSKYYAQVPLFQSDWATRTYLIQAMDSMLPDSPYNESAWSDSEWLDYVSNAMKTVDADERAELIHKAQQIESERGGYLIWGFSNAMDAYRSNITGFVPNKTGLSLNSWGFVDVEKD